MDTRTEPLTHAELAAAYAEFYREMWMRSAMVYGALDVRYTHAAFLVYDEARAEAELEETYEIADVIEQVVFASKPVGHWWTISAVARKGHLDPRKTARVLTWMVENKFAIDNGRGGCWINFGRRS
jgi:hypothetical protein